MKKTGREKEQPLDRHERMRKRLEALEGIHYAQENPDKVFDVISHSETPKDILNNLMEQCRLTEYLAECVREMRLRAFCGAGKEKAG